MKHNLQSDIEKLLEDIPALNQKIINEELNLSNVVITQKTLDGLIVNNSTWKNVDLKSVEGVGVVFKGCTFKDVKINESNMTMCTFEKCTFTNCVFSSSDLSGGNFMVCEFTRSVFEEMTINDIAMEKSKMYEVKIKDNTGYDSKFKSVAFDNCQISNSRFPRALIEDFIVTRTSIDVFSIRESKITKSKFSVVGNGLDFSNSEIKECTIYGIGEIRGLYFDNIVGSKLIIDNFQRIYRFGFIESKIDSLEIRNTNADWVAFYDAKISNALFENTQLVSDRYDGATLTNCTYRNVVFGEDQSFDSTTLESVTFENITKKPDYKPSFNGTVFKNTERF
jgi:uncharacterized protein YjbI with pentapeptide repeats